jgi:hypothetical protein
MSDQRHKDLDDPIQSDEMDAPFIREDDSEIILAGSESAADLSLEGKEIDGERGTGRTYDPRKAAEEGLSYTPPRDPATLPDDDDRQGSEVAAGFAPSMEDTDPDERVLPDRVDRGDLEIQEDVGLALRYNSETAHLTDLTVLVNRGVVRLYGPVRSEDDIARVYAIVSEIGAVTTNLADRYDEICI